MGANVAELGVLRVATPCARDWDKMSGDERSRFCADCQLNVYNLSQMTTEEARALIREKEGQLCVRFYQRADGTVLTRDCPVGVQRRSRLIVAGGTLAASAAGLAALVFSFFAQPASECDAGAASTQWPRPAAQKAKGPAPQAPADESWIEQRRSRFLGSSSPARPVMGRMMFVNPITSGQPKK